MATHHIYSQNLQLEIADISSKEKSAWYQKLERIQRETILPALERQLDKLNPGDELVTIERLEITLELDQPDQWEAILAESLSNSLAGSEQPRFKSVDKKSTSVLTVLLGYLRTGNFAWQATELELWKKQLHEVLPSWKKSDWEAVLQTLSDNFQLRFFRLSQVSTSCLQQCLDYSEQRLQEQESSLTPSEFSQKEDSQKARFKHNLTQLGYLPQEERISPKLSKVAVEPVPHPAEPEVLEQQQAGYFIPNAGLIILHPYLGYLAEKTNCSSGEGNLDRSRFAAILQYCLAREATYYEWEHPLTKLLLGLLPTEPLVATTLSGEDRATAEELLEGVIEHWTVLGSTSPDGLREGFLQRPGKLYQDAAGWHLVVEARAFDVLLAQLPWGISLVKTPWMDELLQVDWS